MDLNHNYIIAGDEGYYEVGYYDVITRDDVRYFKTMKDSFSSRLDLSLLRLTFSKQVNRYIHTPFSFYIYPRLFPHHFNNNKPLVYLFFGQTQYLYQTSYLKYLKRRGVKRVLYMQDVVSRNPDLNIEKVRDDFDLILSYDKGDCERYGLEFYPTPYSCYPVEDNPNIKPIDVYYCGHAKSRYPTIFEVYCKCKEKGLTCKFFITAVPKDKRIGSVDNEIVYGKQLTYLENLQYVQKAKCILEVMQVNADGFTPRLWESIIYDRHLLTNNVALKESPYYIPGSMHNFAEIENIQQWINEPLTIDQNRKDALSPINLLKKIDDLLK